MVPWGQVDGPSGPVWVEYVRGHAYGHIALDILMASARALVARMDLCLLRPPVVVSEALFDLELAGVRRVDDPETAARALAWFETHPHQRQLSVAYPAPYLRRSLLRAPIPCRQTPGAAAAAARLAGRLGLDLDAPMAVVHARARGIDPAKHRPTRDTLARNADIQTYHAAIDLLQGRGYRVVRIGDPSMPRLIRAGVLDLAAMPDSAGLQLACLLRARCLVASESGPSAVGLLTNTPTVTVNATDPISSYPIRPEGRMRLKRITTPTGAPVDPLSAVYLAHLRDTSRWTYHDLTPRQIAEAVADLLDAPPETPAQAAFRARATICAGWAHIPYIKKWGAPDGFLGAGRVVVDDDTLTRQSDCA